MLVNMKLLIGVFIVFGLFCGTLSTTRGYYTIVAPGTIRSNSVFHISITLNDFHQSCWFNISLKIDRRELLNLTTVEVEPGTTELVKLYAPYLFEKRGYLIIYGFRGIRSFEFANINFEHEFFSVFIQSNKPKYRPNELIEFRVICVDHLTRPAEIQQSIDVMIYDGEGNLIKKFFGVKLVQGVFRGNVQLSDSPVLGDWKIMVEIGSNFAAENHFEVARYVAPRFSLKIETKPSVAVQEEKISVGIFAGYFYGKPVKGNLTIYVNNIYATSQEKLPIYRTVSRINGEATIVLDTKNDLNVRTDRLVQVSQKLYTFSIRACLIDDLSEREVCTSSEFGIYSQPYKIKVQAPKTFEPDDNFNLKVIVSVTDLLDFPIRDHEFPIKALLSCSKVPGLWIDDSESFTIDQTLQQGKAVVAFNLTTQNYRRCDISAEYLGVKSPTESIHNEVSSLIIDVLTESPEVGKELKVKLKSKTPMDIFSYEIVSGGDIILSENVKVSDNQTTYVLRFSVTYEMVPKITLFVHLIYQGVFTGQLKDIHIKRAFRNSIQIDTVNETDPGSSIPINVTTDAGSYVGLMGLDEGVLQGYNFKNDLNEDIIFIKLRNYNSFSIDRSPFPGIEAGLVTFSNAQTRFGESVGHRDSFVLSGQEGHALPEPFDMPTIDIPRIRKVFAESWLFKDFEDVSDGTLKLTETIPDTITSWAITGFSLNPKTGLTLTRTPTELKVFQKFFVSFDLPNSIRVGETAEIPIYLKNYMSQDALTNVTIDNDSVDLEIDPKTKFVPVESSEKLVISVKPLKAGQFNITVKAVSSIASDAVQKTLFVKPEGAPYSVSKIYLVHLPEEGLQEDEITIDIPEHAVPGSETIDISIIGDVFWPLMGRLQKLVKVPYGNGEDNMKFIVTNSLVLKYLKSLNYTSPSLESRIRLNLELGYQNQLAFKHLDGSFGLFDRKIERTGDTWQTAFALWGLHQMNIFVRVDSKVRERGLNYLKTKQLENGCFKSNSGNEGDIKLTAFSLMVFLMDEHSRNQYRDVVSKGLQYLSESAGSLLDTPVSFLSGYVLILGRHENAEEYLSRLTANEKKGKLIFGKNADALEFRLRTTVDTLISLFESHKKGPQRLLHIARGLIRSQDDESSQSSIPHLIALHAMIGFVDELQLSRKSLNISLKNDRNVSGSFQVNSENFQASQTFKLSGNSQLINLRAQGYGFAVVDVKLRYNLEPEELSSSVYGINITTHRSSSLLKVVEICVNISESTSQDDLTIMEVNLQSGYQIDDKTTDEIPSISGNIKSIKLNADREKAVIYFDNSSSGVCLELEVLEVFKVLSPKPGWVDVYSAHNKDERSVKKFHISRV